MKSLTTLFSLPALALGAGLALSGCDDGGDDGGTGVTVGTTTNTTATTGNTTNTTEATDSTTGDTATSGDNTTDATTDTTTTTTGDPVDCTGVEGTSQFAVYIDEEADLANLDGIAHVNGDLWVTETGLTNLDALACVKTVAGDVYIFGNKQLASANLQSLEGVDGSFTFSDNIAAIAFQGADGVQSVTNFTFSGNDSLQAISGFSGLATVSGHLLVQINDSLEDISGLAGLQSVAKSLKITQNPSLCIGHVQATVGDVQIGDLDQSSTAGNKSGC